MSFKDVLSQCVFSFDYDGTLCPHTRDVKEHQQFSDKIYCLLKRLSQVSLGVYWNTGRSPTTFQKVDPRFLEFSGFFNYGSLFWDATEKSSNALAPILTNEKTTHLKDSLLAIGRLEAKEHVARFVPKNFESNWKDVCMSVQLQGWSWNFGYSSAEFIPDGMNKGVGVDKVLQQSGAIPVFAGDDFFDASAAQVALDKNGYVLAVGDHLDWAKQLSGNEERVLCFKDPLEMHSFLNSCL